jgi:hypothetical protein
VVSFSSNIPELLNIKNTMGIPNKELAPNLKNCEKYQRIQ